MSERVVYVVIGCDTDPDRVTFNPDAARATTLIWRGLTDGIPRAKKAVESIRDADGKPPIFTWCLRADHQVKTAHGSYAYVMETFAELLLELERSGDELAWHPHFWNHDSAHGGWYQEYRDVNWQIDMLRGAFDACERALPGRFRSARLGWTYHNNSTFAELEKLGIQVEFSALPGHRIDPGRRAGPNANFFDWSITPNHPYYAAAADYRRPARDGEPARTMLEAPVFVSRSRAWSLFRGAVLARKMKAAGQLLLALRHPSYFITITGRPALFAPVQNEARLVLKRSDTVFLVTYFHPDELLETGNTVYSLEHLVQNLKNLIDLAERESASLRFVRACDLPALLQKSAPAASDSL